MKHYTADEIMNLNNMEDRSQVPLCQGYDIYWQKTTNFWFIVFTVTGNKAGIPGRGARKVPGANNCRMLSVNAILRKVVADLVSKSTMIAGYGDKIALCLNPSCILSCFCPMWGLKKDPVAIYSWAFKKFDRVTEFFEMP